MICLEGLQSASETQIGYSDSIKQSYHTPASGCSSDLDFLGWNWVTPSQTLITISRAICSISGCPGVLCLKYPRLGATNKWGTKGSSVQCCEICPRNKYELQKASLDLRLGIVKYKMVGASTKYCTLHDTATWYHPKLPVLSPPPNSTKHKTHLTAPRPKVGPPHDVPVPSSNPSTNFCPTEAPMFIHGHQSSTPKKITKRLWQ